MSRKKASKKDAKDGDEMAPLVISTDRPIWEQLKDAPTYEDEDFEESGYMEISSEPYRSQSPEDDALLTDALPTPPATTAAATPAASTAPTEPPTAQMKGLHLDSEGEPLPEGWEMKRTADGRAYYVCHTDKTTSWVRPHSGPAPRVGEYIPLPRGWEFKQHPKPHFLDHNTRTSHSRDPRPLPEGWEQRVRKSDGVAYFVDHKNKATQWHHPCDQKKAAAIETKVDPHGRTYYVNHDTRETSWDNPLLRPNFFGASSAGLPAGWEKRHTPEGRPYYVNHATRQTSWAPPK